MSGNQELNEKIFEIQEEVLKKICLLADELGIDRDYTFQRFYTIAPRKFLGFGSLRKLEIPKQTYNDRINTMTPEQKAEFLATFSVEKIVGEWCTKLCPQRNAGAEECDCPYSVKDSIEGWLKSEVKERGHEEEISN